MTPALAGQPVLVAQEVKARLLTALEPAWGVTLAGLEAEPNLADPGDVLLVLQLAPECVRAVRQAKAGAPALEFFRVPYGMVSRDDGSELRDAVGAYIAGSLAAAVEDAADRAIRYAAATRGQGGFLLLVHPESGLTRLFLAKAGQDLGAALDLGGIAERLTAH